MLTLHKNDFSWMAVGRDGWRRLLSQSGFLRHPIMWAPYTNPNSPKLRIVDDFVFWSYNKGVLKGVWRVDLHRSLGRIIHITELGEELEMFSRLFQSLNLGWLSQPVALELASFLAGIQRSVTINVAKRGDKIYLFYKGTRLYSYYCSSSGNFIARTFED